jgi:anti-sigma factor RsiW
MGSCEELKRRIEDLAAVRPGELPETVRRHLAECPACFALLARERLVQGLVTAAADGIEPAPDFAEKVLASLPRHLAPVPAETDPWRPAWGLVPAFAATAAALLLFFVQSSSTPGVSGFLPTDGLTNSEQLMLENTAPDLDLILETVLGQGEP